MKFSLPLRPAALAIGLASLLVNSACTYSKADEDTPTPLPLPCTIDAATVRYSVDIAPILATNCLKCHGQSVYLSLGGGHNWDNFTQFQAEAADGTLVKVLEQKDANYQSIYMPRGSAKLSACDIERIKVWVESGAPQN